MSDRCAFCGEEDDLSLWGRGDFVCAWLCRFCFVLEARRFYDEISRMADAYSEKRSDVTDSLNDLLCGRNFDPAFINSRFVKARLSDSQEVLFDTLTGVIEVGEGNNWVALECDYID